MASGPDLRRPAPVGAADRQMSIARFAANVRKHSKIVNQWGGRPALPELGGDAPLRACPRLQRPLAALWRGTMMTWRREVIVLGCIGSLGSVLIPIVVGHICEGVREHLEDRRKEGAR